MKKIIYLLLATPIIFLTSCSSGGGGEASPQNDITGVWELTEIEWDGQDLMDAFIQGEYYLYPDGTYKAKGYTTDGIGISGNGTYSYSNGKMELEVVDLINGTYMTVTDNVDWVNENEVTLSAYNHSCLEGEGFYRIVKTNNSLGNSPNKTIIGVWEVTEVNHPDFSLEDKIYDNLYFYNDGSYREEIMFIDGSTQITIGLYEISSDQESFTMIDGDLGIPLAGSIDKWETDKVEISTPDLLGTGPYSMKMERIKCVTL